MFGADRQSPQGDDQPAANYARMARMRSLPFLFALLLLSGCEQVNNLLGLEEQAKKEAQLEADGRAVGGGCRQSGRAIEDCYAIYSWLPKSAVYAGWRDMDAYMRENNIETIEPQLPPVEPPGTRKRRPSSDRDDEEKTPVRPPARPKPKASAPSSKPVSGDTAEKLPEKAAAEDKKPAAAKPGA